MAKFNLFAAIDIGSSRLELKIFQLTKEGGVSVIENCESKLSIGKESYHSGKISYELASEICACLENFKRVMRDYNVTEYTCYATSAVREASNSEYIRDQIFIRTGFKVEISSNEEERFLYLKAMAFNMKDFDSIIEDGAVIIDLSSGSLQVTSYEKSELKFSQNLPLGSLRIIELMSEINNNTINFTKLLQEYTANIMEIYRNSFFTDPVYKNIVLIGTQVDNIKRCMGAESDLVRSEKIEKLYNEIMDKGVYDFSDEYDMSYEETKQLMSALMLYRGFSVEKGKNIYMPDIDFTDGMCVEYLEKKKVTHTRHIFTNDVFTSALYYAGKYKINKKHVEKTVLYCEEIFKAISKKFGLSKFDLVLLKVAAIYAKTGEYMNINEYNVYSYNIKRSNKLLGLSDRDNKIISLVVLFQNGIFENEEYNFMTKSKKLLIAKLASMLSLALSLDYEYKQKIKSIKASLKDGTMIISCNSDKDITMEEWQFNKKAEFFEEVFGIKARLKK